MTEFFTLAYKAVDSKGREKTQKYVGVFKSLEDLEKKKDSLLKEISNNISFQVYTHSRLF